MTQSVEILIEADDQASKKFANAAKNIDNSIKQIKTTGEQAKKSTEFFGVLANSFGGSAIASSASQLAGLTEKMSQFSEVTKLGTSGAVAFKAGVAGAAAAVGFQLGKAIGDQIFAMSEFAASIKAAGEEASVKADDAIS